jgi:hypothetical protein
MAQKKTAVQVPAAQVQKAADVALSSLIGHARKSGCALKVSTVKSGLAYSVSFGLKSGASAVMSAIYLLASGMKAAASVEPEKVLDVLDKVTVPGSHEGKVLDAMLAKYQKDNPAKKLYGNFDNFRGLIRSEIKAGNISSFKPDAESNIEPILAYALKVK